jgi:RNA polymerase sigma-70 factor (ECF subfamily)
MQIEPAREAAEIELCRLMAGYLEGRIEAFDALYAALAPRLRSYLLAQCRDATLADDLVQDAFLQLHRSRRTYEPGRPVTPWAFAIARHVFLMHRRRTARRLRFEETVAAEAAGNAASRDEVRAIADREELRRAIGALPVDQRRALLMHHVQGWSFAEIAARLGIRVNAAKTRAFRGMRTLRGRVVRPVSAVRKQ